MTFARGRTDRISINHLLVLALLGVVFLTDLVTQLGFAHGILYLPAVIVAMRLHGKTGLFPGVVLLLSLVGTTIGFYFAPEAAQGFPLFYVAANRILSAGILIFSYLMLKRNLLISRKVSDVEEKEEIQRGYLEYFIEYMPIQIWAANPEGEVDFVSGQLAAFTGKSQKDILADWLGRLHPDDRSRTIEVWSKSVASGEPYRIDFRLLRHDGEYIWFQTEAVAQKDAQGNIKRWLGSSIEIDELRRLQQQSDRLAEQLRHTVESITDAFFTLDREFRFTYLNQKAAEILGGTPEQYLNNVIWEGCPIGYDGPFARQYRKAAEERKTLHFEEWFEPADMWLEVHVYPSSDGLTVFFSDVTVQREEKEQLMLLSAAVSRLNDIIMITEATPIDGPGPRTVFVNDAFEKRTGYTREEAMGKSPRILQGPKTDRKELDRIRTALENWEPVRAQLVNYKKSGEEFWLELDIVPLADETGWFTHWVAVERDITEQKTLQEQLAASQKMESIGQLTGGISHDFNNLLTVILGNAELLEEELAGDARLSSLAALICQAADKGAALTRNLLAFARKQPLSPQIVSAADLLRDMQPILKTSLGERNQLDLELAEGLWPVFVDASRLESAILNLAINASDAMPRGGTVNVFAKNYTVAESEHIQDPDLLPGQYVQITFADNGEGIAPEIQKRIFEPFFSTKPEAKGSGLGLSMIYGFLKQSGGAITVYSEPGLGTTFHLYLPCVDTEISVPSASGSAELVSGHQDASVLVVEDNADIRSLAENVLSHHGFRVVSAASGDEALEQINDGLKIDLLFTDVVMPGRVSGPELANMAVQKIPGLRVVLTSGFADLGAVFPSEAENHTLLPKPYRSGELINLIRETLSRDLS